MKLGRHSEMCQCLEVWISELETLRNESCGILVFCCTSRIHSTALNNSNRSFSQIRSPSALVSPGL